jgi:hypothetical protein
MRERDTKETRKRPDKRVTITRLPAASATRRLCLTISLCGRCGSAHLIVTLLHLSWLDKMEGIWRVVMLSLVLGVSTFTVGILPLSFMFSGESELLVVVMD